MITMLGVDKNINILIIYHACSRLSSDCDLLYNESYWTFTV